MKAKFISALVLVSVLVHSLTAATVVFKPVDSEEVKTGEWNKNAAAVIAKAKAENAPVVVVGSQFGCAYCAKFYTTVLNTASFQEWCKSKPWYFIYAYSGTGNWSGTHPVYEIMTLGAMPRVSGYWLKNNGTVVGGADITFAGRDSKANVKYIEEYFEKLFADYKPGPSYSGGYFAT